MRGKKAIIIGLIIITIPVALCTANYINAQSTVNHNARLPLFYEIGFNEGATGHEERQVVIPGTWKLIGVSNGLQPNGNSLWFQDRDGSVYVITGFYQSGQFFVSPPYIGRIAAAPH